MKVSVLLVLGLAVGAAIVSIRFKVRSIIHSLKQRERDVANNLSISSDWVEITPLIPLTATKRVQYLIIIVDGYHRGLEDTRKAIVLSDGTTITPEVELLDANGKVYNLCLALFLSSGVGYTAGSLPQDVSFTRIRIRSLKPFRSSKIIWENLNPK